jgi:hypothetical protein
MLLFYMAIRVAFVAFYTERPPDIPLPIDSTTVHLELEASDPQAAAP